MTSNIKQIIIKRFSGVTLPLFTPVKSIKGFVQFVWFDDGVLTLVYQSSGLRKKSIRAHFLSLFLNLNRKNDIKNLKLTEVS